MSLRSINRRRPSAAWLAAPLSARALSTSEMLAAQAVAGERVRDEARGRRGELASEPARQLPDSAGRVVCGSVCWLGCHATHRTLVKPTLTIPMVPHMIGATNVGHTNK